MAEECGDTCGGSPEQEVRKLYTELALQPGKDFGWAKGKENARALGYDPGWLELLPEVVWESAAAVGNPFEAGRILAGEIVIDLGCGAGADVCIAALLVGTGGLVVGVELTPAMVTKAARSAAAAGIGNVQVCEADMAGLPMTEACADVVISNGAINLSPKKACVLKEAYRVLKPGGRLQVADMVRDPAAEPHGGHSPEGANSWANCVTGTLAPACFVELLGESGFMETEFLRTTGYRTSPETVGAIFRARKPDTT